MGQKWYIDKIKAAAPELLDGNTADILDWIDNADRQDLQIVEVDDLPEPQKADSAADPQGRGLGAGGSWRGE